MKATFDGANKLIIVGSGITSLDVQIDIYSDWKEWVQANSNAGFLPALRTVGGDPTVGIKSVAPYFFLTNGWKIRPYEGNHTLNIAGNLFVDDPETYGSNITVPTIGNYQVLVNMSTTSDAIVLVSGSGVTEQDKEDIVDKVWDEVAVGHLGPGTFGGVLAFLYAIEGGRWKIENNQMIFYKPDNVTEIARFNLYGADGKPSEKDVVDRRRA